EQLEKHLQNAGLELIVVEMAEMLHLKTGVNYLDQKNLLVTGEFTEAPIWNEFNRIVVSPDEAYAANSVCINGTVLVPAGFRQTALAIEQLGYPIVTVDTSEFQKLDGGLSCLSLRF
ncbi:MAG: N(G),N(G)-dimethylarginine dimethylaminohydrolase, partial [Planctomycetaceae bacterium]|nr:N(G),N(G)-dimethylarginine dimethylaminohydrolase [Planctomycetaceae bacterium]